MARVLVATWPFYGHLLPHVEIARALAARRHDVGFYCAGGVVPLLAEEGFRVFPYRRLGDHRFQGGLIRRQQNLSWRQPFRVIAMCQRWVLDSIPEQTADLEEVLASWRPDVLVCDEIMWSGPLILREKHRLPLAVCSTFGGCMLPGCDAPQFGLGIPPLRGALGGVVHRGLDFATALVASRARRKASEYRRTHGLPPLRGPIRSFAARAGLYLARGSREFDYARRDLPACVHYIGPLAWTGERSEGRPAWLSSLPRDKPVVYVSEGTLQSGPPTLLRAAIRGLGDLDLRVVVTSGRCRDAAAELCGARLPPNVRLESWVPERQLLERTDVVVTAGGAGTVLGALAAGVPVLVVPAESDQPDNARRIVACGAGLSLPRRRCTPGALRQAVERLVREPTFRENARRMQQIFSRYDSRTLAVDLIEDLVGKESEHEVRKSLPVGAIPLQCPPVA